MAFRKRRWIREGKIKPIVDVDNKDDNWTSSSDDEFQGIFCLIIKLLRNINKNKPIIFL